jgi:hypothetical protein
MAGIPLTVVSSQRWRVFAQPGTVVFLAGADAVIAAGDCRIYFMSSG